MALDVDAARIRGRWVKHARATPPTYPRRHPLPDNRWQRGEVVDALYLAADEATAWAEWYRHLAENGLPPSQALPRDLWTWAVDVEVADLSDEARLRRVGLALPRPGRRGWPPYQQVGEALAAAGYAGLVTVSAARPGHRVLCLFRTPAGDVPNAQPLHPPRRVSDPPAPPTGMRT